METSHPGRPDRVRRLPGGGAAAVAYARDRLLALLSVLATAAFTVFFVDVMDGPDLGVGGAPTLIGLVERLLIATDLLWLALAAGRQRHLRAPDLAAGDRRPCLAEAGCGKPARCLLRPRMSSAPASICRSPRSDR